MNAAVLQEPHIQTNADRKQQMHVSVLFLLQQTSLHNTDIKLNDRNLYISCTLREESVVLHTVHEQLQLEFLTALYSVWFTT